MPRGEVLKMKCAKCGETYIAQKGIFGSKLPRAGKCPKCGNSNKKLLVIIGAGTVAAIAAVAMSRKQPEVHRTGELPPDASQQSVQQPLPVQPTTHYDDAVVVGIDQYGQKIYGLPPSPITSGTGITIQEPAVVETTPIVEPTPTSVYSAPTTAPNQIVAVDQPPIVPKGTTKPIVYSQTGSRKKRVI